MGAETVILWYYWTADGNVPGQAGDLTAVSRSVKQRGALAGMLIRGFRTVVFFLMGVQ